VLADALNSAPQQFAFPLRVSSIDVMSRYRCRAGKLFAALTLCLFAPALARAGLTGIVIGISGGDTVTVRVDERLLKLRLGEIDAPETGQPFDARATASLAEVCLHKEATVEDLGIDAPRGVFGHVECEGVDAGAEQVRRGMAWVSLERAPDARLHPPQSEARAARRGLWSDPSPVPPWEWAPQDAERAGN